MLQNTPFHASFLSAPRSCTASPAVPSRLEKLSQHAVSSIDNYECVMLLGHAGGLPKSDAAGSECAMGRKKCVSILSCNNGCTILMIAWSVVMNARTNTVTHGNGTAHTRCVSKCQHHECLLMQPEPDFLVCHCLTSNFIMMLLASVHRLLAGAYLRRSLGTKANF